MAAQIVLKKKQSRFTLIQTDQALGIIVQNLTAQFRANGARCARNQHHAPFDFPADRVQADLDRLAAQQIFQTHFTELAHGDLPSNDVLEGRNRPECHFCLIADLDESAHLRAGRRRYGDEYFLRRLRPQNSRQLIDRAENGNVMNAHAVLRFVIIQAADCYIATVGTPDFS